MRDRSSALWFIKNWQHLPFLLLAFSLFYLRFLVSISIALMGLVAIYSTWLNRADWKFKPILIKRYIAVLLVLFAFILLDVFRHGVTKAWLSELTLKLPMLLIPWYMISVSFTGKIGEKMLAFLTAMVVITSVLSVGNYFMHAEEIDALLLQSKHVPIIGGAHHIYFGIFMVMSFWLSCYMTVHHARKWFWGICAILIIVNLHILASRTGLLALYAVLPFILTWLLTRIKEKKWFYLTAAICVLIPVLAYFSSSSLQSKVSNSIEDFNAIEQDADKNYKSLAMRMEAWKTTFLIFKKHTILGVGGEHFEEILQSEYTLNKSTLFIENRIGPHNQFLESATKYGFLAIIALLALFIFTLNLWKSKPLVMVVSIGFVISFLLESVLERQLGMICFGIFYSYAILYSESMNGFKISKNY